jgi:hypothetical protein
MKKKFGLDCASRARAGSAFLIGAALLFTGCSSSRYRADYNGFNSAYADSSNHQMLMNLARLDQHDPAYFLQFGQISVQYQINGSASILGNDTIPQGAHVPVVTGTATVAGSASTTPQFTFIPVTDDKVAQQLLLPLPPEDFYTLFQQGLPVDQLLRLMAERFEIQLSQSELSTFSNTPGRCKETSYIVFLKICAIARELQMSGNLKLRATDVDEAVTKNWVWTPSLDDADKDSGDKPSAKDVMDAHDKNMFYKKDPVRGTWSLYRRTETASVYLEGDASAAFSRLASDPLTNQGETGVEGSRLILRSFMGMITAVAEEQTYFDGTMNDAFRKNVPQRELRPILRMKWDGLQQQLQPALLAISYHGQNYAITDPVCNESGDLSLCTWNRDVFRLLTQLAGQASIDTSKFPLPTSLQLLPSL